VLRTSDSLGTSVVEKRIEMGELTRMIRVTWLALEWPREGQHAGGVGRYVKRLAERMKDLVDLTVVVYEGAEPVAGVRFVTIPVPRGRVDRYYKGAYISRNAVASTGADLVHAHGDDFLLRRGVPIIRSFYGSSWEEAKTSNGLRKLNHAVLAIGEVRSQRRSVLRLGIAPESVERFRCDYIVPPYLRADVSEAERNPADLPTVVFIGSFDGRKQGRLVQDAVQAMRNSGREVRLIVVGPDADASSWEPWVDHRSGLSDSGVSKVLDEAWVLASPSLYEGFGIPILEGLDHHLQVVAFPNPGSEFLFRTAMPDIPLTLARSEEFARELAAAVSLGPLLGSAQREAADQLVDAISRQGSPERLLSIYEDALAATP